MRREPMKTDVKRGLLWFGLLLAMTALTAVHGLGGGPPPRAARSPVAIIVNPLTPVQGLTMTELRQIMLGNREFWPNGQRIILLIRAPVARERNVVLHVIYQMSEAEFRQYWIAKIFRAETATGPKVVYSSEMTNELTAAIPGSIGFLLDDKVRPGPKVLRINGKLPGEAGYPLQ